ncbi:MAG: hypothetical protein GVY14_14705, partial [Spirochaetes bacterium]|nr:hypothetical protein [Spirochaetota bacterium]
MMLSALRMPGNIEGRLADLQGTLFREQGLISARALPPLVPLLWTRTPPELAALDPAPLPPLTVTVPAAGNAGVVLGLSPLGPLEKLATHLAEAARAAPARGDAGTGGVAGDTIPFSLGAPAILLAPAPSSHAAPPGHAAQSSHAAPPDHAAQSTAPPPDAAALTVDAIHG